MPLNPTDAAKLRAHIEVLAISSNPAHREFAKLLQEPHVLDGIINRPGEWENFKRNLKTHEGLYRELILHDNSPLHELESEYFSSQEEGRLSEAKTEESERRHEKKHDNKKHKSAAHGSGASEESEKAKTESQQPTDGENSSQPSPSTSSSLESISTSTLMPEDLEEFEESEGSEEPNFVPISGGNSSVGHMYEDGEDSSDEDSGDEGPEMPSAGDFGGADGGYEERGISEQSGQKSLGDQVNDARNKIQDAKKWGDRFNKVSDWAKNGFKNPFGGSGTAGTGAGGAGTAAGDAAGAGLGAGSSAAAANAALIGAETGTTAATGTLAAGIGATLFTVVMVLLAFLVIILIFAIIFYLLGFTENPILPYVQVTCGDVLEAQSIVLDHTDDTNGDMTQYFTKSHYGLTYGATTYNDGSPKGAQEISDATLFPRDKALRNKLFGYMQTDLQWIANDTCILFGHVQDKTVNNTFGNHVIGSGNKNAWQVKLNVTYDDFTQPPCYYYFPPQNGDKKNISIVFTNPNECTSQYQFQFILGQAEAKALIMQQNHLNDPSNILNNFENSSFFLSNPKLTLPTRDCQVADPGTPEYLNACFADMVGEYFTYPFYLNNYTYTPPPLCTSIKGYCSTSTTPNNGYIENDNYLCPQSTGPHPYYCYVPAPPSSRPSCTSVKGYCSLDSTPKTGYVASGDYSCPQTKSHYVNYCFIPATLTPTLTPSPTPASSANLTFPDFPTGAYHSYYQFAKYNLFDSEELYMAQQQSGAPLCPNPLTTTDVTTIKQLIHDDYGFTVKADSTVNNAKVLGIAYDTFCKLFLSKTFVKLLGSINTDTGMPQGNLTMSIHSGACGTGYEGGFPNIDVNYCSKNDDAFRFVMTHELGHVIENNPNQNNKSLKDAFDATIFQASGIPGDVAPIENRQLPTDNCQCATPPLSSKQCGGGTFGSNPEHECFADMVGEYLVFQTYKHSETTRNSSVTFSEYPTTYANWYDFARKQIFGGIEYVNKGTNSEVANTAIKLAEDIITNCPNLDSSRRITYVIGGSNNSGVTSTSLGCLQALVGHYPQKAIDELAQSIRDTGKLQCVGFARAVAAAIQMPLIPPSNENPKLNNNANEYRYTTQPGYTWYTQAQLKTGGGIKPGDIAVFDNGLNHIGIVSDIVGDGTQRFGLAEANGGSGEVDITSPGNYLFDNNFIGVFRLQ